MDQPEPATSSHFEANQVWRYNTRPGEEASRVIIGKIERWPRLGTVIHIKLTGLRLATGQSVVPHAPVAEDQIVASVTDLTTEAADLEGLEEGYEVWLASRGGAWTITLAELVDVLEE